MWIYSVPWIDLRRDLRHALYHRFDLWSATVTGHENRLRGSRKRPHGLHERKPQHWQSMAFDFRVCSCATKVAFVPRASDVGRRSKRRVDDGRRSPRQRNPYNAGGTTSRPSSHGVDSSPQVAEPRGICTAVRGRAQCIHI